MKIIGMCVFFSHSSQAFPSISLSLLPPVIQPVCPFSHSHLTLSVSVPPCLSRLYDADIPGVRFAASRRELAEVPFVYLFLFFSLDCALLHSEPLMLVEIAGWDKYGGKSRGLCLHQARWL